MERVPARSQPALARDSGTVHERRRPARGGNDDGRRASRDDRHRPASGGDAPFNKNTSVRLVPLREELTGQVHTSLLVLYGAVGVLLSIACFNVANLLLARPRRAAGRSRIRTSLGAGRLAIVRQLLVESLLLAVAGGALGIALARWSLDALLAFAPADLLRVPELSVDRRVLLYALGLSVLTGLLVGLVPGRAGRAPLASTASMRVERVHRDTVTSRSADAGRLSGRDDGRPAVRCRSARPDDRRVERRQQRLRQARCPHHGDRAAGRPLHAGAHERRSTARRWPRFERFRAWSRPRPPTALPSSGHPGEEPAFHRLGTPELPMNERPSPSSASSRRDISARFASRCCADASSRRPMMRTHAGLRRQRGVRQSLPLGHRSARARRSRCGCRTRTLTFPSSA